MNILIAIDSFKGSLSSAEAGEAVKTAVLELNRALHRAHEAVVRPLADGGEGTVEALSAGMDGSIVSATVTGPLQEPVEAEYFIMEDGITAVMEMAAASGITLIPEEKRNPLHTTTYGVGEMIAHAIARGCRRFIIGIGGSGTNDGGVGMLQALGYEFLDADGNEIPTGAKGLEKLHSISADHVIPQLKDCVFRVACDVKNPLCGPDGCSAIYGPQKGADAGMIEQMDKWLTAYAALSREVLGKADADYPGSGAAGGLGFAFQAYTGATLEPGSEIILEETKLEAFIEKADIVVTGEGRLDAQTAMGKAPIGVARLAKKYGKPVIAFSGSVLEEMAESAEEEQTRDATICNENGIDAYYPILRDVTTLEEAMDKENAFRNLKNTAYQVFRGIDLCSPKIEKDKEQHMMASEFRRTPEEVVELYADTVYKIALSQMKNKEDAEDIFQEVFLNYMNSDKTFVSVEHEKAYLITMTVNSCKKHFRSAWFRHRADYSELTEAEMASMSTSGEGKYEEVYEAVLRLPSKYRLVIHLFYYEEMSIAEISSSLHLKDSTVKSQLMRGRAMLKGMLEETLEGGVCHE